MRKKRAFTLIEMSIILLVIAVIITMVIQTSSILQTSALYSARNITKSSIVNDISGLTLWLETTSTNSFDDETPDDGNSIENWNNIEESGLYSYIATATNQPTYREAIINNLPALQFDGSDDYMSISNFKANSYMTLFVVGKFSGTFFIEHGTNSNSVDGFHLYSTNGNAARIRRTSSITNAGTSNWFGQNIPAIAVLRNGDIGANTYLSYKKNNDSFTNVDSSSINNISTTNTIYIGSRAGTILFSTGYFGEIIMFDRALSDDEVDDVVDYLTTKWDINY